MFEALEAAFSWETCKAGMAGVKVFISYAHGEDPEGQMAEYVAEVFAASGLDPWLDRQALQPGQKLRSELVERIRQSDFFVPLLSRPYVTSDWCLREFETAAKAQVPMRPLKISAEPLIPPPYLKDLYERMAGEPVFLDMHSRHAPARLRRRSAQPFALRRRLPRAVRPTGFVRAHARSRLPAH